MTRFQKPRPYLNVATGLALAVVFGIDALTPLGITVWVFYLIPVAATLYANSPRVPLVVAAACSVLLAAGYFTSPPPPWGMAPWIPVANRVMITVSILTVAFVARQFIIAQLRLAEQEWIRTGRAALSSRVQGDHKLGELADNTLQFLCEYVGSPVAALYSAEDGGILRRCGGYALAHAETAPEVLKEGQGLVGQALKDKQLLRFDDVPSGYLPVTSSLGKSASSSLVVVPLLAEGAVVGVAEFGFIREIGRAEMDLLQSSAETVAIAIRSARYRSRQAELLEETQRQSEELQAQQEELRVNNEELEEQSQTLKESQARLEAQHAELEQTNAQLEEQAHVLERQRDELAKTQQHLLDNAEELTRANRYKSEFLANMSHELRTPLNSALILARLLADNKEGNLTADQIKYASTIYSAGNDLLELINDILDLSRIEAGRMDLNVEPVEVRGAIGSLEATFEPMARDNGLSFVIELAQGVPSTINTDGQRLQQVLRNLLSNAFKFTQQGSVSLRVSPEGADRVAFSVRDTGIGISSAQQQVIFEAFRQADGTTSRRYGGTGLGLTISRELARRLGGDIRVQSEAGKGSTFTLTIPTELTSAVEEAPRPVERAAASRAKATASLRDTQKAPPLAPKPAHPPVASVQDDRDSMQPGDRSILVVEDDPSFGEILRDLAHEQRFRAVVASSAGEGLRLAEQLLPSAVLLDVHLPDDSGLAVLEHLKRNPATRHIPVHVVSAVDYAQQALELGAVGYALKPVKREHLVEAINKLERRMDQKLRRVLVVEDVSLQRDTIVALLSGDDVSIQPVATGAEALHRLKESTFDCMVLDLTLPDMSGYELLDRMAKEEAFSFPPVIVYTGRALNRDEEESLRRYASSIIIKGARSPERLLDEVTLFLHQVEGRLPPEQQKILRQVRNREAALEGRTVLVVDDDARNVFALASVLESKGASIRMARNGKEAIASLEKASSDGGVDLVLMDIMMPEMDGLAAIREIRKRAPWKKLPIIALTAKAMPKDRDDCLGAGADDYIAKPLDIDKLLSLVKVWIPK